jgi:drug/metabolite transporter (DMT)-like permease
LAFLYVRKAIFWSGESYTPVPISCFIGLVFFGVAVLATGQVGHILQLSWLGALLLVIAGVIHFFLGRISAYRGTRLVGANISGPITNCQTPITVALGVIFLSEPLSVFLVIAAVLVVAGIILLGMMEEGQIAGRKITRSDLWKGILLSAGGTICWGVSPLLVKMALGGGVSPQAGALISYVAASIVVGFSLFNVENRQKLVKLNRNALGAIVAASLLLAGAQFMRYVAIDMGSVSLVTPVLSSTGTVFLLPFSLLINRKIEIFNFKVILGTVLITAGVLLIFFKV